MLTLSVTLKNGPTELNPEGQGSVEDRVSGGGGGEGGEKKNPGFILQIQN